MQSRSGYHKVATRNCSQSSLFFPHCFYSGKNTLVFPASISWPWFWCGLWLWGYFYYLLSWVCYFQFLTWLGFVPLTSLLSVTTEDMLESYVAEREQSVSRTSTLFSVEIQSMYKQVLTIPLGTETLNSDFCTCDFLVFRIHFGTKLKINTLSLNVWVKQCSKIISSKPQFSNSVQISIT